MQHDFTLSTEQTQKMIATLKAIDNKLDQILPVLIKIMESQNNKTKFIAAIKNRDEVQWLRVWWQYAKKWSEYLDQVKEVVEKK